jgi:hypothetical protein
VLSAGEKWPTEYDHKRGSKVLNGGVCERADLHTPSPSGYLQWHSWARGMSEDYVQRRCPGCTVFKVWVPKDDGAVDPPATEAP